MKNQNLMQGSVYFNVHLVWCHYNGFVNGLNCSIFPLSQKKFVFFWGRRASTHFIVIFCATWLALIPSLVNFEQTLPKGRIKKIMLIFFGFIFIYQTIFNNLHGIRKGVTTLFKPGFLSIH